MQVVTSDSYSIQVSYRHKMSWRGDMPTNYAASSMLVVIGHWLVTDWSLIAFWSLYGVHDNLLRGWIASRCAWSCFQWLNRRWVFFTEWLEETTISPHSRFTRVWQHAIMIIAVVIAFVYPYIATFEGYNRQLDRTGTLACFFTLFFVFAMEKTSIRGRLLIWRLLMVL